MATSTIGHYTQISDGGGAAEEDTSLQIKYANRPEDPQQRVLLLDEISATTTTTTMRNEALTSPREGTTCEGDDSGRQGQTLKPDLVWESALRRRQRGRRWTSNKLEGSSHRKTRPTKPPLLTWRRAASWSVWCQPHFNLITVCVLAALVGCYNTPAGVYGAAAPANDSQDFQKNSRCRRRLFRHLHAHYAKLLKWFVCSGWVDGWMSGGGYSSVRSCYFKVLNVRWCCLQGDLNLRTSVEPGGWMLSQ